MFHFLKHCGVDCYSHDTAVERDTHMLKSFKFTISPKDHCAYFKFLSCYRFSKLNLDY